jgi:hypothetical protein
MDELRAVHSEMQEHAESHRFDADAAARTEVIDEIYKRLLEPTVSKTGQSEAVRMALTLSFMYRLGSPAYSVINGMQPAMVTVPVLGGRHGFLRTMAAYSRAYKDIGVHEVLWRGTAESGRAASQIMSPTFDTRDPLQTVLDRVAKAPDAVFLGKVLNEGISRKKIGNNAGMEIGQLAGSGQGRGKQAIAGLDRMFRQMPAAIEDINRSATMIMAARLGRADGMTETQAIDYAFKTMMETQGDYSAANNPRFMSQKWYSPAFQFKKFAIMEANLLGDMVRRAFHGASPEEKRVAWKQIGGTLMVQMVMAGAVGLPGVELLKAGVMVASLLGVGDGWDDYERKARRLLDQNLGKSWGEKIMNGFSRALGVDLSSRLSLADMMLFSEPKSNKREDVLAYLAGLAIGAPGGMAMDWLDAIHLAGDGEFVKALTKMIPAKIVDDTLKG